jgi:hypothetical protein
MKNAARRFDDLVSLYLDEALDPEGVEELSRLLVARADLAARFVRLGRVHGFLREIEDPGAAERMLRVRGLGPAAPYVWIGIAAAAGALAALIYLFLGGRS